ncbi:MAG: hypothetical protein NT155_02445 [Candidatus Staskawiczbacteria bacterium]|nr:hypothetical protein [Candidatus Staskawiczbacteria bacterium]
MQKKFIIYIVAIIILLGVVFLSQQAYSQATGKTIISAAANQVGSYLAKGSNWVMSGIYPKIDEQVKSGGETITNAVNQEKQKVSEDIGKKIENYFSGIANAVAGKNNTTCQPTAPQTANP